MNRHAYNVLAIGAHPDDIEYGCAGTLIRHQLHGDRVFLLMMTDGAWKGDPEMRRKEQVDSTRIIGAEDLFFGGYPDTELVCTRELIVYIEEVVKRTRPDLVYVNYVEDTHQDHRNLAQATIPATRAVKNVLYYEGMSTQHFLPTLYVDIGSVLHKKLACLEAHISQVMNTNIEGMSIVEIARSAAHFRGIQGRVQYAEGFMPVRYFLDV
ncbi:MAG: PIG-L family deacetylase [Candidatus Latescibacteria bacterium]|nr:PIG-L family deacetylase [Candidatus Latescibacterota bacterium]